VERNERGAWLAERRSGYYGRLPVTPEARSRLLETGLRRLAATVLPVDRALPRAVDAVYAGSDPRLLDVVQLDYYDPVAAHFLRLPGHRTAGGGGWQPTRSLWDEPPAPDGLRAYPAPDRQPDLHIRVVENGLCKP